MKIKDWIKALSSLDNEDEVVGDRRYYDNTEFFDLVMTHEISEEGEKKWYDFTPIDGN